MQIAAEQGYIDELSAGLAKSDLSVVSDASSRWADLIAHSYDADVERNIAIGMSNDEANKQARAVLTSLPVKRSCSCREGAAAGGVLGAALQSAAGAGAGIYWSKTMQLMLQRRGRTAIRSYSNLCKKDLRGSII